MSITREKPSIKHYAIVNASITSPYYATKKTIKKLDSLPRYYHDLEEEQEKVYNTLSYFDYREGFFDPDEIHLGTDVYFFSSHKEAEKVKRKLQKALSFYLGEEETLSLRILTFKKQVATTYFSLAPKKMLF